LNSVRWKQLLEEHLSNVQMPKCRKLVDFIVSELLQQFYAGKDQIEVCNIKR
jgi:hypothetical protein